jgi:phosphotriesterase-related protein
VLGVIDADKLGKTLTHEHFALDFSTFYTPPPPQLGEHFEGGRITLANVGYVKQYPYASKYNLAFGDEDAATAVLNDVVLYKKYGGGAIVENTTHGLKRDLKLTHEISKKTGVHVVAGTGFYVADVQPASALAMTTEQMTDLMIKEILFGVDLSEFGKQLNVKCGVIGEVGSGWPIQGESRRLCYESAL